jgi:Icc protein
LIDTPPLRPFHPNAPDAAGVVSWAHIGDLHMTIAGEHNHRDLLLIVDEINTVFSDSLTFVYIPGDVADKGSASEYEVVREALDRLKVPWCSIVGDHDVHEKSFANFLRFMAEKTHYRFTIGSVEFFALNAFDVPDPGSFILLSDQLIWLEEGLKSLNHSVSAVLLLHCYPTDLKQGGGELRELVAQSSVRLVDMGHTHYNEVANDGKTLYTATRSTGQIEEGPAGFSITNIDGPVISWKFLPLGTDPAVVITSPADERFITEQTVRALAVKGSVRIRAKAWSSAPVVSILAQLGGEAIQLSPIAGSQVWEGELQDRLLPNGVHTLHVEMIDEAGKHAVDEIRVVLGESAYSAPLRAERDQDNAIEAWPERGLLGTQLGPNKFGRKW